MEVPAGHVLRGVVEQQGIDVVVRVLGPDGALIAEVDSPNGTQGPEPIDAVAQRAGTHTIQISPLEENTAPGRYVIRIDRILSPEEHASELAADRARKEAAIEWMREHAIRLAGARAGSGFEDLRPLGKTVGDARVVALGEATHGTREFFQMKHRMLEYLVAELGFTAFGIEATLPEAFDVDRWVVTGEGDPQKALAALYFWTWNTEEVLDLIEWMRAWNADPAHSRKVRFYGFDMQFPVRAAKIALETLAGLDPKASAGLRARLGPVTSAFEAAGLELLPQSEMNALLAAAGELQTILDGRSEALTARQGDEQAARARRSARVLVQSLEMTATPNDFSIRDRAMAENALWALEQEGPGGKIALWAHNGHVATVPSFMGHEMRLALGEDLRVIGFAFSQGAFQARGLQRGSGLTTWMAPPPPEGTLDAALAEAGLDLAALDLRALPAEGPVAEWLSGRRSSRSIGAIYGPEVEGSSFDPRPVREMYDALIFVKQTSAARAMSTALERPRSLMKLPSNLDFERGEPDAVPTDWRALRWSNDVFGYRVEARGDGAGRHGRGLCVAGNPAGRYGEAWGGASQVLDPAPYIGHRVRLSGWVRTVETMEAHMRIAPDSAGFSPLPSGSASSQKGNGWQPLLAETDVDTRAVSLTLSVGAEGVGSACFDDLAVEILPASGQGP